ncbi:MAG: hypothetical protein HY879_17765 [Deltaproteobacteria bacterium]|nr:hypothetical protein [Deltaproteobacteria bacterium]
MTSEESAAVKKLKNQYHRISNNLDKLFYACGDNPFLKEQVEDNKKEALKNYILAHNLIINQSTVKVKQLMEVADKTQEEIDQALEDLKNIRQTLFVITEAVKTVGIAVASL